MEVHHHSHPSPSSGYRKKWTHYFWEFFMLFLAVFCGFLAELQLEHYIEHQREKIYISSLFEDLKNDTATLRYSIIRRNNTCKKIDSVIMLLKSKSKDSLSRKIYHLAREIPYSAGPRLGINIKTFDQLKSSGNLRLIRKTQILETISDYYYDAATITPAIDMSFQNQHDYFLSIYKLFDASIFQQIVDSANVFKISEPAFNPPLLTNDPVVINEICTRFHFTKSTHMVINNHFGRLQVKAINLIEALKNEYHLK